MTRALWGQATGLRAGQGPFLLSGQAWAPEGFVLGTPMQSHAWALTYSQHSEAARGSLPALGHRRCSASPFSLTVSLCLSANLKLLRSTCLCLPSAKMKGRTIMPTKPTQNTRLRPDSSVASQEERCAAVSEHGQDTDHTVSNSQHPTRQRSHGAQDKRCLKYHFNKTGKAEQAGSGGTSQEAALARASLKAALKALKLGPRALK